MQKYGGDAQGWKTVEFEGRSVMKVVDEGAVGMQRARLHLVLPLREMGGSAVDCKWDWPRLGLGPKSEVQGAWMAEKAV